MSAPTEAAMAAAREIQFTSEQIAASEWSHSNWTEGMRIAGADSNYVAFHAFVAGTQHFQPLLAKVEGERDELKITLWNREQDILGLRREQAEAFSIRDAALNKYSAVVDLLGESLGWQDREATLRAELAAAKAELAGERNLHGQTRVVVDELNTICNDLRNAGQPQFIRSEAIRLLREDQAQLRADLAAKEAALEELVQASHVFQLGTQTGQQWLLLNRAILCARSALASRADKGGAT